MRKIKITQAQYDTILLREQLNRPSKEQQMILETSKEALLGIAMLAGVKLSGQNEFIANKALKEPKTMSVIKSTLEDKSKTDELIDKMTERGFSDPTSLLSTNADKIKDKFNEISSSEKLDFISITNLKELQGK